MFLATADPAPWSAPVYYRYSHDKFYFFSNPESRHVRAATAQGRCAASVYRESDTWQDIEGLQMEGTVQHIETGKEAFGILSAYLAKFPAVKDFFAESAVDLSQFCKIFHADLYAFRPTRVFYLNNHEGFATRSDITTAFTSSP